MPNTARRNSHEAVRPRRTLGKTAAWAHRTRSASARTCAACHGMATNTWRRRPESRSPRDRVRTAARARRPRNRRIVDGNVHRRPERHDIEIDDRKYKRYPARAKDRHHRRRYDHRKVVVIVCEYGFDRPAYKPGGIREEQRRERRRPPVSGVVPEIELAHPADMLRQRSRKSLGDPRQAPRGRSWDQADQRQTRKTKQHPCPLRRRRPRELAPLVTERQRTCGGAQQKTRTTT